MRGSIALPFACAVLLLSGCGSSPLIAYSTDTPPLVLANAAQAGVADERARFREIFCAVLEAHGEALPDYRPCDEALTRVGYRAGTERAAGQPRLLRAGDWSRYSWAASAMSASMPGSNRRARWSVTWPRTATGCGASRSTACRVRRTTPARSAMLCLRCRNPRVHRAWCSSATRRARRTSSKRWSPTPRSAAASPPSSAHRARLPGRRSPTKRSSTRPRCSGISRARRAPPATEVESRACARRCAGPGSRANPLPADLRYYSLVTFPDPERISSVLKSGYRKLSRIDGRNDGQMVFYDQVIPAQHAHGLRERGPLGHRIADRAFARAHRLVVRHRERLSARGAGRGHHAVRRGRPFRRARTRETRWRRNEMDSRARCRPLAGLHGGTCARMGLSGASRHCRAGDRGPRPGAPRAIRSTVVRGARTATKAACAPRAPTSGRASRRPASTGRLCRRSRATIRVRARRCWTPCCSSDWILAVADVAAQFKLDLSRIEEGPAAKPGGQGITPIRDIRRELESEALRAERVNTRPGSRHPAATRGSRVRDPRGFEQRPFPAGEARGGLQRDSTWTPR